MTLRMIGELHDPAFESDPTFSWITNLIAVLILIQLVFATLWTFALYHALFARTPGIKWTCGSWNAFLALTALIGLLAPIPEEYRDLGRWPDEYSQLAAYGVLIYYVDVLLVLGFTLWIVGVLLRDLRELAAQRGQSLY